VASSGTGGGLNLSAADQACAGEASKLGCIECCALNHDPAFAAVVDATRTCACATSCQLACNNYCQSYIDYSICHACLFDLLAPDMDCYGSAQQACSGDVDCLAYVDCRANCALAELPASPAINDPNCASSSVEQGVSNGNCSFAVPTPTPPATFDDTKLNVSVYPGAGYPITLLYRVVSATVCGNQLAWYYSADKQSVRLCPASCTLINSASAGDLTFYVGCPTWVVVSP
jgi:hypothetical protein